MGTTADKLQGILDSKADIKDAIEAKGVTVGDATLAEYAGKIAEINGGQEEENYDDDVIFIDYDGKVLYRYTAQEFLALEEMPANPSHEGLIAQGWNWELQDAQDYVRDYGKHIIGQVYTTDDGKTRLYVTFKDSNNLSPTLQFSQNTSNGVTINWGDGNEETISGTGAMSIMHSYSSVGDYVITIGVTAGRVSFTEPIFDNLNSDRRVYAGTLRKVHIGNVYQIGNYVFSYCINLRYITIPNGVRSGQNNCYQASGLACFIWPKDIIDMGYQEFRGCDNLKIVSISNNTSSSTYFNGTFYGSALKRCCVPTQLIIQGTFDSCTTLESVVIPDITDIKDNGFFSCLNIKELTLPESLTTIGNSVFRFSGLYSIIIPKNVTSIGTFNFYQCDNFKELHMKSTTPPTITSGSIGSISSNNGKIYVPYSADHSILNAYQTATNWSAYASYMEEEPNN